MAGTDREAIQRATHTLNHVTRHLAELMMNRSVREALTGKNVNDIEAPVPSMSARRGAESETRTR